MKIKPAYWESLSLERLDELCTNTLNEHYTWRKMYRKKYNQIKDIQTSMEKLFNER